MFIKMIFLTTTCLLLTGCYSERHYRGDGDLSDNGAVMLMGGRYLLNLGQIDFSDNGRYEFTLQNLPPDYIFTAGLAFTEHVDVVDTLNSSVSVNLRKDGKTIISTPPVRL